MHKSPPCPDLGLLQGKGTWKGSGGSMDMSRRPSITEPGTEPRNRTIAISPT